MNYREAFAHHPDCSAQLLEYAAETIRLKREAGETVVGARLWTERYAEQSGWLPDRTQVVGYIVVTTDGIDWFDLAGYGVRAQALHSID